MINLKPSLDDLRERHDERLKDQEERTRSYYARVRRFRQHMVVSGGIIGFLTTLMSVYGGRITLLALVGVTAAGALASWFVAWRALGPLRGMMVFSFSTSGAWLTFFACGMIGAIGMFFLCCFLLWVVCGAVMGMASSMFDQNNEQI